MNGTANTDAEPSAPLPTRAAPPELDDPGPTMAHIFIRCPRSTCKKILTVAAEARGQLVTCSYCKQAIRVPQPKTAGKPADKAA